MKRICLILTFLFALTAPVFGQNCDDPVVDTQGYLGSKLSGVNAAASDLISQGADVRIRTVGKTSNLDLDEKQFIQSCASWQSQNGGIKSTLIVFLVSPVSRKQGIYYGSAWKSALDGHWDRIRNDYITPRFKDGDWAGGLSAGATQFAARLKESKSEALHPVAATTVNQAVDMTGFWYFLGGLLLLGALIGMCVIIARVMDGRRKTKAFRAQAIATKARVASTLHSQRDSLDVSKQEDKEYAKVLDEVLENFAELAQRDATNPDVLGYSAEQYSNIEDEYRRLLDRTRRNPHVTAFSEPKPRKSKAAKRASASEKSQAYSRSGIQTGDTIIQQTTVVPVPIAYEAPIVRDPDPEPERSFSHHSSSHHHSSDSDDDSGGSGGSSSWGSSSRDSDSGGSSSFDFGGGGGSSFDGGGGGSSDF